MDDSFDTPERPTEIHALLWDPNPNARLWETVRGRLATGELLTVTFSYEYLGLADARVLWRFLAGATEYLVTVVESDAAGYWAVEGRMQKQIYLTLEFLNDWVKWMAATGLSHGARYFDWDVAPNVPPHQ